MFLGHFACRRRIPTLLLAYGLWGKLSDRNAGFVSSLVAVLRRNCPEVCVRRRLDLMGNFGTFSRIAVRQFPSFSLVRRFTRTQFSCSPRETRTHLLDILREHKLGGRIQFGCAPQLRAGFPSAPEVCGDCRIDRLPSVGPPSGCTGHCATVTYWVHSEFHAGSELSTKMKFPIFSA